MDAKKTPPPALAEAWRRCGAWVRARWGLTDGELEDLQALGVIPFPDGRVEYPPALIVQLARAVNDLIRRVEELEAAGETRAAALRRKGTKGGEPDHGAEA